MESGGAMKPIFQEMKRNMWSYRWVIVGVAVYYTYFIVFHSDEPNCIIKHTLGVPCPGCGMSRATLYLMTFQWKLAFSYHPLVFLMPFIVLVLLLRGLSPISTLYHSKWFWSMLVVLFLGVYVIRMIVLFPHTEPMTYYSDSWLGSLLQFIK
jgi:hypothetical protein